MPCSEKSSVREHHPARYLLVASLLLSLLALQACGGMSAATNQGTGLTAQPEFTRSFPAITSISPASPIASATTQKLVINGTGFAKGATVTYHNPKGKSSSGHTTTFVSSSQIIDNAFNDANMTGTWTATVVNSGNLKSNPFSFTVTLVAPPPAPPVITGVSPSPVPGLSGIQQLTINGSGFQSGATLTYRDPQGNASAGHATTFGSASQLVDTAFNDANNPGAWTVTVVNPGNTSSNAFSFTVTVVAPPPAPPAITGVSPSPVPGLSGIQQLTINGSGFQSGATVSYHDPQGNIYAGHAATFVSATQLMDPAFNNANDAGAWTVTVVDPTNGTSNTFSFTVTASAPPPVTPIVTGVAPSPIGASSSPQQLTINGSGFQSGATVSYHDPQGNASSSHVANFVSAKQLVDSAFNDANNAGTWTVTVVNPDTTISSAYSFTVTSGTTAPAFTLVQHKTSTCTASPCADAINSTAAGDLLVLWSAANYSGSGNAATVTAFTGASGDGTWTHCPNQIVNYINGVSTARALDCWYILSAYGGATSVSASWTFAGLTSPSYSIADELFELQPASSPVYYDTGNAGNSFVSCSTCKGPAATLSGPDAVLQATILASPPTAIAAPYATPDILSKVNGAFSLDPNQSSYVQPVWSGTFSANPSFYSTIAFGNSPNPTPTLDYLIDFSACTAGSAPTAACATASTFAGAFQGSPYLGNMGSNLIVTNAGPSSPLPFSPTIFNGQLKTGANAKNLSCTTNGTAHSCGPIDLAVDMIPTSVSIGYTFQSDCPATGVDCGAIGGIFSRLGPDFDVVHLSVPTGKICFETQGGSGCAPQNNLNYVPGKAYRVNMQINTPPAAANYITVCEDGPGGAVLASWSNGATTQSAVDNTFVLGISGEEPPVAGYHYYWRNVVVSLTGQLSSTSCF